MLRRAAVLKRICDRRRAQNAKESLSKKGAVLNTRNRYTRRNNLLLARKI